MSFYTSEKMLSTITSLIKDAEIFYSQIFLKHSQFINKNFLNRIFLSFFFHIVLRTRNGKVD